jgi:ComF family protein
MYPALNTIVRHTLDLIFPIFCIECGKESEYLCPTCWKKLKRDEFQLCPICAKRSPFGRTHYECRTEFGLDGLISAVPYKEPTNRHLVEYLKYQLIKDVAPILGKLIVEELYNLELVAYFENFSLVPLPLHPTRLRWRGFNQSQLIANEVNKQLNIRIDSSLLIREKKTKVQAELKDEDRKANIKDAFITKDQTVPSKIIILDDVANTRSTITEACKVLKHAGAKEVWGLVFAQG